MLKSKTIITDKATLIVVECPKTYSLFHDEDWQLIGRLPDITEEQAERIVSSRIKGGGLISYPKQKCFKDYKNGGYPKGLTSLYSLKTLLQANEIYFENPLGDKPVDSEFYWGFLHELEKWEEAQSKVWDKERCYLFIKVE